MLGEGSSGAATTSRAPPTSRHDGPRVRDGPRFSGRWALGGRIGIPRRQGIRHVAQAYAEDTQAAIVDRGSSGGSRQAEERAAQLWARIGLELDGLVDLLIEKETVDGEEVYALLGRTPPSVPRKRKARTILHAGEPAGDTGLKA